MFYAKTSVFYPHCPTKQELKEMEAATIAKKQATEQWLRDYFRPANPIDYACWLRGFIRFRIGTPNCWCDHPISESPRRWFVAIKDFFLLPRHGMNAYNIIVPKKIRYTIGKHHHHNIFKISGYQVYGTHTIPLYPDVEVALEQLENEITVEEKERLVTLM